MSEDKNSEWFYCYSRRCALFIRSMGIRFESIGTHPTTKSVYTKFKKSDKLDEVLKLWYKVRYIFDSEKDGDC